MPFRNRLQKESSTHDRREHATFRESSRRKLIEERKEMEHEFNRIEKEIRQAISDGYVFSDSKVRHNMNDVMFVNKNNKHRKRWSIEYRENYCKLKKIWEGTELS
ncbi:MAG: hypothetical protein JW702_01205 [Clostridiales bacterium]|nr:hypothetical protein [Clostridiales bacterium]